MAAASGDTVAIVDDDEPVRHSLRFLLEVMGYKVETFASADEFLKAEPDKLLCLITDHHLPGITGLELTERLRTQGNSVPIMLITGLPSRAIYARQSAWGRRSPRETSQRKPSYWHSSTPPSAAGDRSSEGGPGPSCGGTADRRKEVVRNRATEHKRMLAVISQTK